MEDYKELIKELLLRFYATEYTGGGVFHKSTQEVLEMCRGVIPHQPISEHDVFEILKELNFSIELTKNDYEEDILLWVLWEK